MEPGRRVVAAGLFCLAATAARAAGWPRVVTDGLGRDVVIPAQPQRIVAIFASNVEILAAMGLLDRIAGIEAYTRFPLEAAGKPLVGGRLGFSVEAIARLGADLIIMSPSRQAAATLTEPLGRVGIPVLVVQTRSLAEIGANITLFGAATGAEHAAEACNGRLQARLEAVRRRVTGYPPVSAFLETSSSGSGAFGTVRPGTYTNDALNLAGGRTVFPAMDGPAQVSGEAILRADPAIYLVAGRADQAAEVARRPGFAGLRAVRDGAVQPVTRAFLLIPGPRIADGVEQLAHLLHPHA